MTSLRAVLVTQVTPRHACAGKEGKRNPTHSQLGARRRWVIRTRLLLLYSQERPYIYGAGGWVRVQSLGHIDKKKASSRAIQDIQYNGFSTRKFHPDIQ